MAIRDDGQSSGNLTKNAIALYVSGKFLFEAKVKMSIYFIIKMFLDRSVD